MVPQAGPSRVKGVGLVYPNISVIGCRLPLRGWLRDLPASPGKAVADGQGLQVILKVNFLDKDTTLSCSSQYPTGEQMHLLGERIQGKTLKASTT